MTKEAQPKFHVTNAQLDQIIRNALIDANLVTASEDTAYLLAALLLEVRADRMAASAYFYGMSSSTQQDAETVLRMAAHKARQYAMDLRSRN